MTGVTLTDATRVMSQVNIHALGLVQNGMTVTNFIAYNDGTNGIAYGVIRSNGDIEIVDVLNRAGTASMSDNSLVATIVCPVVPNQMNDSYCDKFYWKRTA